MSVNEPPQLTRREREIMDVIYRLGEASVSEIMEHLPQAPTSGAIRRMLNLLRAKGVVEYRHEAAKKVYRPTTARRVAGASALRHVVETFFAGSAARTIASLFRSEDLDLTPEERDILSELIEKAKERGR